MPFYKLILVCQTNVVQLPSRQLTEKTLWVDSTSLHQMTSLSIWLACHLSQLFLDPKTCTNQIKAVAFTPTEYVKINRNADDLETNKLSNF